MVRDRLDVLDALGILFREIAVDVAECVVADREALQLGQGQMNEGDEVFHLDTDTIADECILREKSSQRLRLASVSSVNRRHGSQHIKFHIVYNNIM